MNATGSRAIRDEPRGDHQRSIEPRGRAVADRAFADRIGAAAFFPRRALIDPGEAEQVRAGAFHVAQVIGVIDHPRQIGVLEIDAQRQTGPAPDEARREENTPELPALKRSPYAVFCFKTNKTNKTDTNA